MYFTGSKVFTEMMNPLFAEAAEDRASSSRRDYIIANVSGVLVV